MADQPRTGRAESGPAPPESLPGSVHTQEVTGGDAREQGGVASRGAGERDLDLLKARFLANIGDELRTPLSLILGPVRKRLGSGDLDAPVRRELEIVERSARLLLKHVNDLLDLSRLEAGAVRPRYAQTDLARLARVAASHFAGTAADSRIELTVEAPASLPAHVDPGMLQRVLLNLLWNAVKFTPVGGSVNLIVEQMDGRALIRVEDSGRAIPEHLRQAVFERFRGADAHPDARREEGGTGLGLSIARGFVLLHGGTIAVGDAPRGGARFSFEVPVAAPPGAEILPAPAGLEDDLATQTAHLPVRSKGVPGVEVAAATADGVPLVLVIEDNPDMRQFLAQVLGSDFRVASAPDGRSGLDLALQVRPDLVLTEIMLPRMGGRQLLRELRARPELESVPVVFLTARQDDELRGRLSGASGRGVEDFVNKPFAPEDLLSRVRRLVSARRRAQERFRLLVEAAPNAIIVTDHRGRIVLVNEETERLFGYARAELLQRPVDVLFPASPAAAAGGPGPIRGWGPGGPPPVPPVQEVTAVRQGGGEVAIELRQSLLGAEDGTLVLAAITDITERKRAERRQAMMTAELDHRVKNNLAVVLSIAGQTMASARSLEDFEAAFIGRVRALARVHNTLAKSRWEGAPVRELVWQALQAYSEGRAGQVSIEGPEVMIPAKHGQSLSLALHELATNAVKYGALSTPRGHVEVRWALKPAAAATEPVLQLQWRESGGPPVTEPSRRGFGTTLIQEALAYELQARAHLRYAREGFSCTIEAPLPMESTEGRVPGTSWGEGPLSRS